MREGHWAPPRPAGPLDAEVFLPGSKSATSRALVLSLLASEPTTIRGALRCRDTDLMVAAIEELGAEVRREATTLSVTPPATLEPRSGRIDCGLAGTVMRFLAPVAALANGDVRFDGDPAARVRPMAGLLDALADLGVAMTFEGEPGHLPVVIHGSGRLAGGHVDLDASQSSQFLSALLLAAPRMDAGIEVTVDHEVPSLPHVAMTLQALRERGAAADVSRLSVVSGNETPTGWRVEPGALSGGEITIEPDLTNAGPFLAAPLIAGGQVRVLNWPQHTTQPGDHWRELLTMMGGRLNRDDAGGFLSGYLGPPCGITLNMARLGELVPTVAALAACAVSPSTISGIRHLRGHETDRLDALETTLRAVGVGASTTLGSLTITPARLHGAELDSFGDHRMVMTAALLGLATEGISVRGVEAVTKTFPDFPDLWEAMVATGAP